MPGAELKIYFILNFVVFFNYIFTFNWIYNEKQERTLSEKF
jgi:hypothetical protein